MILLFMSCSLVFLLLHRLCVLQPVSVIAMGCYNRFICMLTFLVLFSEWIHEFSLFLVNWTGIFQTTVHGEKAGRQIIHMPEVSNANCSLKGALGETHL